MSRGRGGQLGRSIVEMDWFGGELFISRAGSAAATVGKVKRCEGADTIRSRALQKRGDRDVLQRSLSYVGWMRKVLPVGKTYNKR